MHACTEDRLREARVLGRFRSVINLILAESATARSRVMALVTPDVPMGPLHLVVDRLPALAGRDIYPVSWGEGALYIGSCELRFTDEARIWDPRPSWGNVSVSEEQRRCLRDAARVARTALGLDSLKPVGNGARLPREHRRALAAAVVAGDLSSVRTHAAALSGYGLGLTPSGDDFLAGLMLALWADHHPCCEALCRTICDAAIGRTTTLSLAFLAAAARGEADQSWHHLLLALSTERGGCTTEIQGAVATICAFGATSGVDMLTGFTQGLTLTK